MKTIILTLILAVSALGCADRITVSGRVVRSIAPNTFVGISKVRIDTGRLAAITNPFGYFSFIVPNCGTFPVTAAAKGYSFDSQILSLPVPDADEIHIDFIAK